MKKVIFISALAIAAAVSCTKSDIVDTKFDEAISFENYIGRDAMTKAAPYGSGETGKAAKPEAIGVYGFYTGAAKWSGLSKSNLWGNLKVDGSSGSYNTNYKKFWTNSADYYTFLAYAPFVGPETEDGGQNTTTYTATYGDGSLVVPAGLQVLDPSITYTVPTILANQKDVLYSYAARTEADVTSGKNANAHIDVQKGEGTVNLNLKHALSRITVKARLANDASKDVQFDVKEISLTGTFNKKGALSLATGKWDIKDGDKGSVTYLFHRNGTTTTDATVSYNPYISGNAISEVDYSAYTYYTPGATPEADPASNNVTGNYLMIIPTEDNTASNAVLNVVYTTYYAGQESVEISKSIEINNDFEQGKAYAFLITFSPVMDDIKFSVTVEDWDETTTELGNPEDSANNNWN